MNSHNKAGKKTIINFSGDVSFGAKMHRQYLTEEPIDQSLLDFMNDGDASVIDYECAVTSYRDVRSIKTGLPKRFFQRSDPESFGYIRSAFTRPILDFANNHVNDVTDIGMIDTADNADAYGLEFIGLGRDEDEAYKYIIVGEDIRVGIFAVEYKLFDRNKNKSYMGPALNNNFGRIQKNINELRKKADYVVIVYHGGTEFANLPDPGKKEMVKKYIDMGCDAVVSHHPHVVQGYEYIGGKPVFYSLGNFLFDTDYQRAVEGTDKGLLLKLIFTEDGIDFETAPVRIDREEERAVPGEMSENFYDISTIDYDKAWKKEEERLQQVNSQKKDNKDDVLGSSYLKEIMAAEKALEKIALNDNPSLFNGMRSVIEDKIAFIEKRKKERGLGQKPETYYLAYTIASETHRDQEDELARLEKICKHTGLDPRTYYFDRLYLMSDTGAFRRAKKVVKSRVRAEQIYSIIGKATGKKEEALHKDRKIKRVSLYDYYHYGLWLLTGEELKEAKAGIAEIKELKKKIKQSTYAETVIPEGTVEDIDRLYALTKDLLSEERKNELKGKMPDGSCDDIAAVDMHIMNQVWGYTFDEYRLFDFKDKSLEDRLTYVSTSLKNDIIDAHNPGEACDLLNNKYLTYGRIGDLYGRDAMLYDGSNIEELLRFTEDKKAIVIKSPYGTMGKEVRRFDLPDDAETKSKEIRRIAEEAFEADGDFIAEELISQHAVMEQLNKDSVNTVRICTFNRNGDIMIHEGFAKSGRAGSFVDNAGSGGILAHLDTGSGCIDSVGADENGMKYERHPDSGAVFKGYRFPEWEEALRISKEAASLIPELGYIGWDLTYTEDCKWIIIEGNARPQVLGQLPLTDKGLLDSFRELAGGEDGLKKYYREK